MADTVALRPALPADAPALAALFRASVEKLGAEDYSEAQVEAWSALADDEAEFAKKLATNSPLSRCPAARSPASPR